MEAPLVKASGTGGQFVKVSGTGGSLVKKPK